MSHLIYLESHSGYGPAENERRHAILVSLLRPGFTIEHLMAPEGPRILEQAADFEQFQRAGLAAVRAIGPDACGAIIAAGAVDPGLKNLRAAARVPVIGPGEASLFLARTLGARLTILMSETGVAGAHAMVQAAPAKPETVLVRSLHTTVRKILADMDEGRRIVREAAAAAVREDHADVIYLGSMTQGYLGVASQLRSQLGIPVIDPVSVAVDAAQQAAAARGA